jgi:5-methyltetrahydrofolate--homocysteine methyltransferase
MTVLANPKTTARDAAPRPRAERAALLGPLIAQRILVIDGAMGTLIQSYQLDEAGFRGSDPRFADHPRDLRGDNDLLSITQPEIVRAIHDATSTPALPSSRRTPSRQRASPRPTTASRASSAR